MRFSPPIAILILVLFFALTTPASADTPAVYIVRPGDTLGVIAQRYGTSVVSLLSMNRLADPDHLIVGQRLFLPAKKVPAPKDPVRLAAPVIALDAPVVSIGWYTTLLDGRPQQMWSVPDRAAGWHKTSAPVGEVGNTVISGHSDIHGEIFRWIEYLRIGDQLTLYAADGTAVRYKVAQKLILPERDQPIEVRRRNAVWAARTGDTRLTLITCWPYKENSHRLIVVAFPENR